MLSADSSTDAPQQRTLVFAKNISSSEFCVFKLNKQLLEGLQQGERLYIKGLEDDDAVLCNREHTFEIKAADTSNTVMVTEPPQPSIEDQPAIQVVKFLAPSCYELRKIPPRLTRVHDMLKEAPYDGPDEENAVSGKRYSRTEIENAAQASAAELNTFLDSLNVIHIDGAVRLLSEPYYMKVVDVILTTIVAEDLPMNKVPLDALQAALEEFQIPPQVVTRCLNTIGSSIAEDEDVMIIATDPIYELDQSKIALFRAMQFLDCSEKKRWNFEDFKQAWKDMLFDSANADMDLLKGNALIDNSGVVNVIEKFRVSDLSADPIKRFAELFKKRSHWLADDIVPYVRDLCAPGEKVEALLLKHARCTTDPKTGAKSYNSRYGVK